MAGYLLSNKGPGLTVSSSNSNATLAIGDTISMAAGTTTKVTAGATASLAIGPTTSFNLGTTVSFNASTTISFSASKAKKIYADDKTETAENTTNSATGTYLIQGGTLAGNAGNVARISRKKEIGIALLATAASLAATIGGSIYGLMNPPFTVSSSTGANGYATGYSSSWSGLEIGITAVFTMVVQMLTTKYLFNQIQVAPVAKLTLDSNGFKATATNSNSYTADIGITSPANTFPVIELNTSSTVANSNFSNIYLGQKRILIKTKNSGVTPTIALNNSTNGGTVSLFNNSTGVSNGVITMDNTATKIMRPAQNTLLQVGSAATNSALNLQNNQAALSATGGGQTGAVTVTPNSVVVGTGANNATFNANGITLGGVQISSNQISIGGVLTVMASAIPGLNSAIQLAQQTAIQAATQYTAQINQLQLDIQALQTENATLNTTINTLRKDVEDLIFM